MSDVGEGPAPADSTHLVKAVVLVVVVVLVAILLLHRQGSSGSASLAGAVTTTTTSTTAPASGSSTATTVPAATIPPNQIKLQVLNGLQTGTLAGTETTKLAATPGYLTATANDTTVRTTRSVIYCASGYYTEGLVLARTVGLPASDVRHRIPASAPLPAGVRGSADLILVIGSSLAAKV